MANINLIGKRLSRNLGQQIATDITSFLALLVLCATYYLASIPFIKLIQQGQFDDSYITYRYATRLATGYGLTFNDYERVSSASSLLYTVLLSISYLMGGADLPRVATIIGIVSALTCLVALTFAIRAITPQLSLWAVLPLFALSSSGSFVAWSASGMETTFFVRYWRCGSGQQLHGTRAPSVSLW